MSGLSTSQRVAVSLSLLLVAVSAVMLVQWSGAPDRVPLLDQSLSPEEQAGITRQLAAIGADYETRDDQIMVPPSDRSRLLAVLQQSRSLPTNTSVSFARLMEENNPFMPRDEARWRKERALEAELSNVLAYFDGVTRANVFIQIPQRRRIGGSMGKTSASVHVSSRRGAQMNRALVESIASFVSGAVEGLSPADVKIVDSTTGRAHHVPGPDDAVSFDVLALRRQHETEVVRKITAHLSYIPGVLIGVHAELNLERKSVRTTELGKPVISEEESSTANTSRNSASAGPGVRPNVGRAVTGGGTNETTQKEESKAVLDGRRDETVTSRELPPGDILRLTASINVPRSYFESIFQRLNPDADSPDDAALNPIIGSETQKIRAQVIPLIAAADADQVEVDWFYDHVAAVAAAGAPGAVGAAFAASGGDAADYVSLLLQYGPKAGLGLLALISLLSVWRIARRANAAIVKAGQAVERAAQTEAKENRRGVAALESEAELAGEAGSSQTVLTGHELGEDEVRISHLVKQIGDLVHDDGDAAAAIVEQWVSSS